MTLTNQQVVQAFWRGEEAKNKSMRSRDGKLYSYYTVILQMLPDGRKIGNVTKYSHTTGRHQSEAGVNNADVIVRDVPRGCQDLKDIKR
jgi:hypothetical protein